MKKFIQKHLSLYKQYLYDQMKTLFLTAIAIGVLFLLLFVVSLNPPHVDPIPLGLDYVAINADDFKGGEKEDIFIAPTKESKETLKDEWGEFFVSPPKEEVPEKHEPKKEILPKKAVKAPPNLEKWRKFAVSPPNAEGLKKIVIIIDDMGLNETYTRAAEALPAPLTMAYLPYAPNVDIQVKRAQANGHEILIHTPMEPMSKITNPGPIALLDDMTEAELNVQLDKMFASFEGYVGINNHMGSRLTQNSMAMNVVMDRLAERGLLFVDSKTIRTSVASDIASEKGLYFADRDVFLDHEETPKFVGGALLKLERIADKKGVAIAIGHPKKVTVDALREWLPTLEAKGFVAVPISDVVRQSKDLAKPVIATNL